MYNAFHIHFTGLIYTFCTFVPNLIANWNDSASCTSLKLKAIPYIQPSLYKSSRFLQRPWPASRGRICSNTYETRSIFDWYQPVVLNRRSRWDQICDPWAKISIKTADDVYTYSLYCYFCYLIHFIWIENNKLINRTIRVKFSSTVCNCAFHCTDWDWGIISMCVKAQWWKTYSKHQCPDYKVYKWKHHKPAAFIELEL